MIPDTTWVAIGQTTVALIAICAIAFLACWGAWIVTSIRRLRDQFEISESLLNQVLADKKLQWIEDVKRAMKEEEQANGRS